MSRPMEASPQFQGDAACRSDRSSCRTYLSPCDRMKQAECSFHLKRFDESEVLYNRLIGEGLLGDHELSVALNNRGQIKYRRVDFHEAVEDYTMAVMADGQFPVPYYNRGVVLYRLGLYNEAIEDFRQVLKLDALFEDAKAGLKQALLDRDHTAFDKCLK
uniref:tetratricopeptide repeat protein 32-like n=1 Tax=Myxine glutinosa TaxID=7769 RepID=UPI00358EB0DC